MNTLLYASLSANGSVLLAEEASHQIPPDVMADFMGQAMKAGNLVMGRKTYELILKNPAAQQAFSDIEVIIISGSLKEAGGFQVIATPSDALKYLEAKGFETGLIAGGSQVYQSFLAQGLIHELLLNFNPLLTGKGDHLIPSDLDHLNLELIDSKPLSQGVIQTHYRVAQAML